MEPLTAADPPAVREFRLLARLGAGGMGRVYLATSPAGRLVALKVIQPQFADDAEFIRRFRAEVDAAQRVSGLYTAPVVAAGVNDSPPWLATAFVPGPSLQEVVAGHGPLPPAALWRLAAGLAEALRAIHTVGLVHRDLKPANVLLAPDGPRVIDFGIARAAAASTRMTATGAVIGTPSFMSPEQVEGTEAGPMSDVFSFGSVVAFAATGASPFAGAAGSSTPSIMFRVVHGEPALDGVPGNLREVVAACLAKEPAQRPDLRQVAARSAAAFEYLGLSPTEFWPADVAGVIDAQVAALSAELQSLHVPAGQLRPPVPNQPGAPGTGGYPGGPGSVSVPPGWGAAPTHPSGRGTSRRAVLIGAGAAGAAAIAGAGIWGALALEGGRSASSTTTGPAVNATAAGPASSSIAGPADIATTGPASNTSTGPGSLAWRFPASKQPNSPAVAGDLVCFGSGDSTNGNVLFYAVSAKTGKKAWTQVSDMVSVAPQVHGGNLYLVDARGYLQAVNAASGNEAWYTPGLQVNAGERNWDVSGTQVAFAPGDGSVLLLDAATGKQIWKATSSSASWVYAEMSGTGTVYAFDPTGGSLSALSITDGQQQWQYQVFQSGSTGSTSLVTGDGGVYVGDQEGSLYCVDTTTRKLRWNYPVPGATFAASDLVIAGGLVYFTDNNGVLRAITAAGGTQAWSYQVGTTASPAPLPAVADGYLYVPTENALQQLHAASGAAGWSFTPDSGTQFVTSAAVGGGLVFAGCNDIAMYAIRV